MNLISLDTETQRKANDIIRTNGAKNISGNICMTVKPKQLHSGIMAYSRLIEQVHGLDNEVYADLWAKILVQPPRREKAQNLLYIQHLLHIQFPPVLKDFYLNYNRTDLKPISFCLHNIRFDLDFIIPLDNSNVSVEKILSFNKDNEYIPKTFIPLAEDIKGDDFYWDSGTGAVYYLTMGNIENPIPVADSVEDFFLLLKDSVSDE